MSEQIQTENEDTYNSQFPQKRQDQMEQHARDFAAAAWAARNGDKSGLARHRADSAFEFGSRQDAGAETIYIARQLEMIRAGLYEVRYTEIKSPRLVSYNTSVPRGVVNFTVKAIDTAGEPMIERDDSDQVPQVEMKVTSGSMTFFNMQLAYSYTDQDAAEAMYAGMPLPTLKAKAVRDAMARKLDVIAFYGETISGVKGLLNQSGTSSYTVPATGAGGSKLWKDKDSDAILLDLNGAGDTIITTTLEVEEPDTWLIPLDAHRVIATKRVGDGTSDTVLKYFTANRDGTVKIERTVKSQGANNANWSGAGSESRMLVYKNDPQHVEMQVPVPFFQGAPQYRGFRTTTFCMMRTGGIALYLPKTFAYADGVS